MCGIVFTKSNSNVKTRQILELLYDNQMSRGTSGYGMLELDTGTIIKEKNELKIFDHVRASKSKGVLFHHRTPTSTPNVESSAHPFTVENEKHKLHVVHNGVISNCDEVLEKLKLEPKNMTSFIKNATAKKGYVKKDRYNDSEALAWDFLDALTTGRNTLYSFGSIALMAYDEKTKKMYMFRNNRNPLKHSVNMDLIMCASELPAGEDVPENSLLELNLNDGEVTEIRVLKSTSYYDTALGKLEVQRASKGNSYYYNQDYGYGYGRGYSVTPYKSTKHISYNKNPSKPVKRFVHCHSGGKFRFKKNGITPVMCRHKNCIKFAKKTEVLNTTDFQNRHKDLVTPELKVKTTKLFQPKTNECKACKDPRSFKFHTCSLMNGIIGSTEKELEILSTIALASEDYNLRIDADKVKSPVDVIEMHNALEHLGFAWDFLSTSIPNVDSYRAKYFDKISSRIKDKIMSIQMAGDFITVNKPELADIKDSDIEAYSELKGAEYFNNGTMLAIFSNRSYGVDKIIGLPAGLA